MTDTNEVHPNEVQSDYQDTREFLRLAQKLGAIMEKYLPDYQDRKWWARYESVFVTPFEGGPTLHDRILLTEVDINPQYGRVSESYFRSRLVQFNDAVQAAAEKLALLTSF